MRKYFGTDGMRGRVNDSYMTPENIVRLGLAVGSCFRNSSIGRQLVVIGKDTRLSGYMIEPALVAGLTSAGIDVMTVGPIPTPAVSILIKSLRANAGIMISASHNPYYDNGIKIFGPDSYKLSDAVEKKIESLMDEPERSMYAHPKNLGSTFRLEDACGRYTQHVESTLQQRLSLSSMKIALDTAHGAAYKVAPKIFRELGAQVLQIGAAPNGYNINDKVGATAPQVLANFVVSNNAHVGFALDGDADRVVAVDERGNIINGDQIIAVIATYLKSIGSLRGPVVTTHMSNMALANYLSDIAIDIKLTQVGDRYVAEQMRSIGSNFGGEHSGHLILSDFSATGDGIVASLWFLSAMQQWGKLPSQLRAFFTPYPQILKNIAVEDFSILDHKNIASAAALARRRLGKNGRLILRKSGTEKVVRIMVEGDHAPLVQDVMDVFTKQFQQFI